MDPAVALAFEFAARDRIRELSAENERLRKGIQDWLNGDYEPRLLKKTDKCSHGRYGYEGCEACTVEHFERVLAGHAG